MGAEQSGRALRSFHFVYAFSAILEWIVARLIRKKKKFPNLMLVCRIKEDHAAVAEDTKVSTVDTGRTQRRRRRPRRKAEVDQ